MRTSWCLTNTKMLFINWLRRKQTSFTSWPHGFLGSLIARSSHILLQNNKFLFLSFLIHSFICSRSRAILKKLSSASSTDENKNNPSIMYGRLKLHSCSPSFGNWYRLLSLSLIWSFSIKENSRQWQEWPESVSVYRYHCWPNPCLSLSMTWEQGSRTWRRSLQRKMIDCLIDYLEGNRDQLIHWYQRMPL